MNKRVLDMCCGPRMMWFDKENPLAAFCDKRSERHEMPRPKRGTVEYTETRPDYLCDFTALPFGDGAFSLAVFDPPHFVRSGKPGFLAKKYGWLEAGWQETIRKGFTEGFRCLSHNGVLIFKWTDTETPVREVIALSEYAPLFGHKSAKQQRTHWLCFLKNPSQRRTP